MEWQQYKSAFVDDGFQRHILVQGTTLWHWQRYFRFLGLTQAKLHFFIDGEAGRLPLDLSPGLFAPSHNSVITIEMADISLHCTLNSEEEIRFDFNPGEIDTPQKAQVIFRVMSTLGRRLRKEVRLYHEHGEVLFRYRWGSGGIRYLQLRDRLVT